MSENFKRLIRIRTGGGVERCHGVRHQGSYRVDSHSWGVAMLMLVIWPDDFPRLAIYCLSHDVPEAWVGDIPAPTKKYCPEIKIPVNRMERGIFNLLSLPVDDDLAPLDKRKLRACDTPELYLWAKEQVHGGNLHASCVCRELEGFYETEPLLPEAQALFLEIKAGSVEHATDGLIRELNR